LDLENIGSAPKVTALDRRAADDLGVTKDLASKQTTWNLAERGHRV
jgi:hypothetical protein